MPTSDRYTIISADTHAGGSHAQYREYLEPGLRDEFDAWRGQYKNPFKDLGDARRLRNWDDEMRTSQQETDGVVGEVIFPNTVPPFFPGFVLFARPPKPDEYALRLAGIRAHNRWLVDFCGLHSARRAGVGQIFINNLDDALEDVRWIKEHNLRGGILLPTVPPDCDWVKPLYDRCYDPLWELCQDLEVPINCHGGTGSPEYKTPVGMLLYINEVSFYSQRPLVHMMLAGVFERFPRLRFVLTEQGCAWIPPLLRRLDDTLAKIRNTGQTGEIRYGEEHVLPRSATEYFHQNVWVGASQPAPDDAKARTVIGLDRFMWGSDYPHDEGTYPFTREHLRQVFPGTPEAEMRDVLATNAARLYGFDLDALAPLAAKVGPTVEEISRPLTALPEHPNEALLRGAAPGL